MERTDIWDNIQEYLMHNMVETKFMDSWEARLEDANGPILLLELP